MATAASAPELLQAVQAKVEEQENRWTSGPAIVLYVAAVMFIAEMLCAIRYGYHVDELYFLGCSEHLAWGYIDQPPLIVFIAFLARHLLGESLLALRFLPALAGASLVCVTGSITRELGGKRFAQTLSAIAVLVSPAYLGVSHLLHITAFEPVIWAGCAYFAVRAIKREAPNDWLWAGAIAGLGLENKYTIAVFLFGVLLGLVFTSAIKSLLAWQPWAAAGLALLLFAPNLIWEIIHHFPFLEWQRYIRAHPDVQTFNYSVSNFLLAQALATLPVLAVWAIGIWFFLISARGKQFRFLGIAILVVFGVCFGSGKSHYTVPAFAIAYAGGAIAIEGWTDGLEWRWLRRTFVLIIVGAGLILVPLCIPVLPVERLIAYQRWLGLPHAKEEAYTSESEIPQFAREFGWDEMVAAVARVYYALPEDERAKAGILTASYGEAGAVDLLGKKYGLPKAICGQLSYHDFGPRNYTGDVLIVIAVPDHLSQVCRSVQYGATLENPYGYSAQRGPIINVCRGLLGDLQRDWPSAKHY